MKNEIRISTTFRNVPEEFIRNIIIHELAHLKEKEHNKSFYKLCCHMEPDYGQIEFDIRLFLTYQEIYGKKLW
jgi:predicted metal-dependent hydrolase